MTLIQYTERDCYLDECDGEYVYEDDCMYCISCGHAPRHDAPREHSRDPYYWFWKKRHSAVEGGDRPRMIGGFIEPYIYKD